ADVLVFLAVSCIPSRRLLQIFAEAATNGQTTTPTLWHSSVSGLTAAPSVCYPVAGGIDALRADRDDTTDPVPVPGQRWRHSFAMTARDWLLVLPAVHSAHPFGMASSAVEDVFTTSSVRLRQVPGATAYRRRPHLRDLPVPASA
uniref:hypothetical protein n=1 Tax=Ornithinimicrobium cerasi TaxID=2248773 RepID=UPI00137A43F3